MSDTVIFARQRLDVLSEEFVSSPPEGPRAAAFIEAARAWTAAQEAEAKTRQRQITQPLPVRSATSATTPGPVALFASPAVITEARKAELARMAGIPMTHPATFANPDPSPAPKLPRFDPKIGESRSADLIRMADAAEAKLPPEPTADAPNSSAPAPTARSFGIPADRASQLLALARKTN